MSLYRALARRALAPGLDLLRGTHTMQSLSALEESQWWPRSRIEALQFERLQALLRHAYESVPYYRRVMQTRGLSPADFKSVADLARLPILTKDIIRANGGELRASSFPMNELRPMATSGSIGDPLAFCSTAEDQFTRGMARTLRALQWAGIKLGDRYVVLARPRHYAKSHEQFLHGISLRVKRVVELDTANLSDSALSSIVARINPLGRTGLMSSPPILALLARWLKESGTSMPSVTCIVSGGEQLLEHERHLIAEAFGLEPFSKYGSFEAYDIASECDEHNGLHIQAEDILIEVIDDLGDTPPPGTAGRLLITNLHNFAMPFIRYEIGDFGAVDTTKCRCGRELPRLAGMLGRMSELIVTPKGRRVFGANLGLETFGPLGVRQFRVVQRGFADVDAYLVWHDDVAAAARAAGEAQIRATLERAIGDGVVVRVHPVQRLALTAAGKHCVVVSEVAPRSFRGHSR